MIKEIISCGYLENKHMYPHRNAGMEIVLLEQGHLNWAVESVPEELVPGSVFFTLPWQAHGSLHIREPRNRLYFILFKLQEEYPDPTKRIRMADALGFSEEENKRLSRIFTMAAHHAWPSSELLRQIFPELVRRTESRSVMDQMASAALLRTLVVELADIIQNTSSSKASRAGSPTVRKVRTFLKSVSNSADHPWTLNEMADQCGIKRTHFSDITRQITGYSPIQYLGRIRFEQACRLLADTGRSITDIAFECGYSSSQYFCDTFKKQAGVAPSEYRTFLPKIEAVLQNDWSRPETRSVAEEKKRSSAFRR